MRPPRHLPRKGNRHPPRGGLHQKTDVARQICTDHQRSPETGPRQQWLSKSAKHNTSRDQGFSGEWWKQRLRATTPAARGVVGCGEGLDETGSPRRPSPILAMRSASTRVSTRL